MSVYKKSQAALIAADCSLEQSTVMKPMSAAVSAEVASSTSIAVSTGAAAHPADSASSAGIAVQVVLMDKRWRRFKNILLVPEDASRVSLADHDYKRRPR